MLNKYNHYCPFCKADGKEPQHYGSGVAMLGQKVAVELDNGQTVQAFSIACRNCKSILSVQVLPNS